MATEKLPDKMTADQFRAKWDSGELVRGKKGKIELGIIKRASEVPPPKKSKYGNIRTEDPETGSMVDSKLEAKHRKEYRQMLKSGLIKAYCPQAEFMLTGGIKYRADHLLINNDGSIEVIDSKGMPATPDAKMKQKLMKADHDIDVVYRKK